MENGNKEHKKRQKHEICRQRDIPRIDVCFDIVLLYNINAPLIELE
jgi:hypothetical protein